MRCRTHRPELPSAWAGRLPLASGAAVTVATAVTVDVLADEHPTHTLGLALVVAVVAGLRLYMAGRHASVFAVVTGALVAQPALHATADLGGHGVPIGDDGLLHVVTTDGPVTLMQVAVSAAIVVAVAAGARIAELFVRAVCRPVLLLMTPGPPSGALGGVPVVERHGSMLRWCGWIIRAARRGPPVPSWH